ncbi:prenyltransferase/squalene oxidase repeat-containing protein [Streptomyces johnsoniae]|uniref:Prenyltransferase/squalene oxidase repeat-containing protein n=1 Tax=Streptomyces johnsoniae TaxID=3075532 RepID=A0ABU2SEE3_9ACTN|nr:prenyltransferase/squalene oxidase repeat-containing protein [Streptomyces sp. DSM 41886]MDT0447338.1 prenyltransferase/squalene oxidase repeat-containing protein [Streptomyces sp. DSM 41886]
MSLLQHPRRARRHRDHPRPPRRGAAVLTGAAVVLGALGPAAEAARAESPALPDDGLFGEADPQYDGVWRQSVALLAQDTAGYTPAGQAVDWLLGQQCDDGAFLSYRADPGQPCADVTAADTNATALAVQALTALDGHEDAADAGLSWLTGVQNEDGGWSYNPGGASDANSTALVIGAFAAAGRDPGEVRRADSSPYDALAAFQLGCDAPMDDQRGAFAWQPDQESGDLYASDLATVDAVLASYGRGLLVDPDVPETPVAPLDCEAGGGEGGEGEEGEEGGEDPEDTAGTEDTAGAAGEPSDATLPRPENEESATAGAAYLAGTLDAGGDHLTSTPAGGEEQPDYLATARAVVALAAAGHGDAASGALSWLVEHHGEWPDFAASPTAVGTLVMAAHAGGVSPEEFGGTDLMARLNELGPDPHEAPGEGGGDAADDGDGGLSALWVIGIGLAFGALIGVTLVLWRSRAKAGRA